MWNADKSLMLSIISVRIFFVIGLIFLFGGYPLTKAYVEYVNLPDTFYTILIAGYSCLCLAFGIFYFLHHLLNNIRKNQVFVQQNADNLRAISWLCMGIACISAFATAGYIVFFVVAIVFAFIALIIRVIKNVIVEAIQLKEENDFTI